MAIDNITSSTGTNLIDAPAGTNPNGILGKDDFMMLLLTELKYQDPTEPMDSDKILSQTSQLAGLEASENTNKALEQLAASLGASRDFSTIAAIGKIADTGSNAIVYEEGSQPNFELYFSEAVASGNVEVLDANGNIIATIPIENGDKGIHSFEWDGKGSSGDRVEEGIYYITASYNDTDGNAHETRVGLYPIESVRFDGDETLVKIGSSYIPFTDIKEVMQG